MLRLAALAVLLALTLAQKQNTLVLVDTLATRETHSIFLKSLQERGHEVTVKAADDPSLQLSRFGEYIYQNLVILAPGVEEFGGALSVEAIVEFIDGSGNVLVAGSREAADLIRELVTEVGVEMDEEGAAVIDHLHYDANDDGQRKMTAVSTALSLEALEEGFQNKISALQICADLRGGWKEDTVIEFGQLKQELQFIRQEIVRFKAIISSSKKDLLTAHTLLELMQELCSRLTHMKANLPSHLPRANANPSVTKVSAEQVVTESDKKNKTNQEKQAPKKDSGKSSQTPTISYVTVKEFNDVPKYIRGRLQYDQVNVAVDEVNKTLETKYTLLRRPRAKLSEVDMKVVMACRQQENQETKGLYFVVDNDIKRWSGLKLDSNGRSIMTVLRTLKRLREVRGPGNLVRYAVLL